MLASFNGLDYAIFILLFLSTIMGITRGLIKEVISVCAWVLAFIVATLYATSFAALMFGPAHSTGNPIESISMGAIIISYMVIFVGILLLGSFIKFIVNYAVEGNGISVVNRILGAIFGLLRGTVIVLLAMFFVGLTTFATRPLWKDSQMVAVFKPVVKWVSRLATPYLAVLEAKMKKTTQDLNNQELNDVIKTKTVRTTNTVVPTPTPAMVIVPAVRTPDGPAPAPAITPAPPAVKPAS